MLSAARGTLSRLARQRSFRLLCSAADNRVRQHEVQSFVRLVAAATDHGAYATATEGGKAASAVALVGSGPLALSSSH
eukprot:889970-Prymnesium_polylepis.1